MSVDIQIKGELYGSGISGFSTEEKELISNAIKSSEYDRLAELINSKDGFFVLKIITDQVTVLVSDRIRSFNAGFGFIAGRWQVFLSTSDKSFVPENYTLLNKAKSDFLYSGYVQGNKTFFCDFMQMLPGQIVVLNNQSADFQTISYSNFFPTERRAKIHTNAHLTDTIINTFKRCIYDMLSVFPNRKFLVPLSGGYDSRFILVALIECGVKKADIICYTYGQASSHEVKVSQQVAKSLGVPWYCVETDFNFWEKWGREKKAQFDEYTLLAAGFGSCPVYQDWPVVGELLEMGIIDKDMVVVPGHAGDFVAGSHLVADLVDTTDECAVIKNIIDKHFSLKVLSRSERSFAKDSLAAYGGLSKDDSNAFFEWWDWRERQSKLIMNSVRAYEYWGLDWWCPFWSKPFFDLFVSFPSSYRRGTAEYLKAVHKLYNAHALSDERVVDGSDRDSFKGGVIRAIKNALPVLGRLPAVMNYTRRHRYVLLRRNHPMGWHHLVKLLGTTDNKFTSFYADYSQYSYNQISHRMRR